MTPTRAPATPSVDVTPRRRSLLVDFSVGALLVLVALVAMVAGGWFSVTTSEAAGARPGASAPPALVLQCPLGVHRVPLGSRLERPGA